MTLLLERPTPRTDAKPTALESRRALCVHEAGHCVALLVRGLSFHVAVTDPGAGDHAFRYTGLDDTGRAAVLHETLTRLDDFLVVKAAGFAGAEARGDRWAASDDGDLAECLDHPAVAAMTEEERRARICAALAAARAIFRDPANRRALDALAAALEARGRLTFEEALVVIDAADRGQAV